MTNTLSSPMIKRLERNRSDKVVAGVAGGLGRYFDLTPAVFRLGFVVLTLLGGAGILVYVAAVLVMPKEGDERSTAEDILANRRDHPGRIVALGLVAVAILSLLARADTWPSAGTAWGLIGVAALIFLWTGRRRGRRGILIGVLTLLALLLITTIAAVATAFAWFDVSLGDGTGTRTYSPTTAVSAQPDYHLGMGQLEVDLSQIDTTKPFHLKARLGIGELRVTVPHDEQVVLTARVKAGSIDALGLHDDGTNARVATGSGGRRIVDAKVGAGHIDVVRAP